MSIWSSRFGKAGVNLAVDNSFRLQITNDSNSPFTLNLFNLGGGASTQTSITTSSIGTLNNLFVPELLNGVLIAPITFEISQGVTIIVSIPFVIGQTINDIMAAVNPVINLQGQSGTLTIQQSAGDLTGTLYDQIITTPSVTKISYSGIGQGSPTYQIQTYVTNNPLVTIRSNKNTNLNFIQNSEIGNSYKITGMDVYSPNAAQVLEPLSYFYRDANGDLKGAVFPPTIDPYQPNRASLQMIYVGDFQITTNTQFQYNINALTNVYLTYNYVNFSVADFREFNQIFYQQVTDKYLMDKKLIKMSRVKSMNVE
jgi:hypothetical protein